MARFFCLPVNCFFMFQTNQYVLWKQNSPSLSMALLKAKKKTWASHSKCFWGSKENFCSYQNTVIYIPRFERSSGSDIKLDLALPAVWQRARGLDVFSFACYNILSNKWGIREATFFQEKRQFFQFRWDSSERYSLNVHFWEDEPVTCNSCVFLDFMNKY